jgi:predicted kinase
MARSSGTPITLGAWIRNSKVVEASTFELSSVSMEGPQIVATWTGAEVLADHEAWCAAVDALATQDAQGRGQTTRYELRHVRDDRVVGTTHLRRVLAADKEDASSFDGSSQAVIRQLAQSMERAHSQVIEAARAAIEAQRASMVLLGQAYTLIGGLQASNVELHAEKLENSPAQSKQNEAFSEMLKLVGPVLMKKLMEGEGGAPPS